MFLDIIGNLATYKLKLTKFYLLIVKLPFGIYQGKFIHISEVDSGKTEVLCPYCQQKLLAKKGRIKRHHFAHDGKGCTQHFAANFFDVVGRLPTGLPLSVYAKKKLTKIHNYRDVLIKQQEEYTHRVTLEAELMSKLDLVLQDLSQTDKSGNIAEIRQQVKCFTEQKIAPFPSFHLIRLPQFTLYTDGKRTCSFAALTTDRHEYFYPDSFKKYISFLKNYHRKTDTYKENTTKLTLFKKDLTYFKQFDLYFIEVRADHQKMYKIGLTSRRLDLRLKEITQDLRNHFLNIQLKPLFRQKGFAFLESFFKQKYAPFQLKIGQMTEYFSFSDEMLGLILKDLNLLKFSNQPKRNQPDWIDWIFFNFKGKIYGYREKSVYVNNNKIILTKEEAEKLNKLISEDQI